MKTSFGLLALVPVTALLTLAASNSYAADHCEKYQHLPKRIEAISTVATQLKYSMNDLCNLERIADIYVDDTVKYDERGDEVEIDWVTLHYSEYSCQYFVRKDNRAIFAKNCYNTF